MANFFDEWLHMNFLKGMGGQLKAKIADGKSLRAPWKGSSMCCKSRSSHLIGWAELLLKFVTRPVTAPKVSIATRV